MVQRFPRQCRNTRGCSGKGGTLDRFALFSASCRRTFGNGHRTNERRIAGNARCRGMVARTTPRFVRKIHGGFGLCHLQHCTVRNGTIGFRHERHRSLRRSLERPTGAAEMSHCSPSCRVDEQKRGRENRSRSTIATRTHRASVENHRAGGRNFRECGR